MTNPDRQLRDAQRRRATHRYPDFVARRLREYYVDRLQNAWGGSHPLRDMTPPPDALHFSSNDYLSLLDESALRQHQAQVLLNNKRELLMSSAFLHRDSPQHAFERRLAHFIGAEDGVICQSGWAANVGLLQSLAAPDIPVYLDMHAHASLREGALAAGARFVPFLHNNVQHARSRIAKHGAGVIAVDSVYSTSGSVAPLPALVELAEATGLILVVDESHALGTHGPGGRGLVCELGLAERVHFRTASLAKAFAGRAGFISCSSEFKEYFACESRPAIFSSGLLAHEIAWFDAVLPFISTAHGRRARLHQMARYVRRELTRLGYALSEGTEQIIALESGTERNTLRLRDGLQRRGVFGAVFCAPATPKRHSLVRLTLNAGHTDHDIERLLRACADLRSEVNP